MKEREIIKLIHGLVTHDEESLIQGIGDDCAVVKATEKKAWLLTMDTLVESVHFNVAWHPPKLLGRKTISVNVSDIAAMGGKPLFILLSLGLPSSFDTNWLEEFTSGISEACDEYGCFLIGGDTVRCPEGCNFSITAIGEAPVESVLYRNGAKVGDDVWVTGYVGMASAGLELFLKYKASELQQFPHELQAHLDPSARTEIGRLLAKHGIANSMMDVSDGLATDLSHIADASNVQVQLIQDLIPTGENHANISKLVNKSEMELALFGGEDYELVFTADAKKRSIISDIGEKTKSKISRIGKITAGKGVILNDQDGGRSIKYKGFDHFI